MPRAHASAAPGPPARGHHLADRLLEWYERHRRDLPWRRTRDPYAILVSEVMLQQTQVDRVVPKYHEFLARFPTLAALAAAPLAEVIRAWAPLGYNLRAVRLHRIAQAAVAHFGGHLPDDYDTLLTLPGLGPYSAAAVVCFAFGQDRLAPDTNVRRVLARVLRGRDLERGGAERALLGEARSLLPSGRASDFNQALMDLGATVCLARAPRCLICPLRAACAYAAQPPEPAERPRRRRAAPFAGSSRYYRGRVLAALRDLGPDGSLSLEDLGRAVKPDYVSGEVEWLAGLVGRLAAEGLVRVLREDGLGYEVGPEDRVALP